LRAELGLADAAPRPYPWAFAALIVVTACVPLVFAKMWSATFGAVALGFVALPLVRLYENREVSRREDVYRFGAEAKGRVLDVEPPTAPGRSDHIVRLEFWANGSVVQASIIGCPLARRGLAPDDAVILLYAPDHPTRCLVLRKDSPEVVDAIFDD
jgi:hypothetical protein